MGQLKYKKQIFFLLMLVLLISLGLFYSKRIQENEPHKLEKVTIAQSGDFFLYAPLYIAIDNDFFKKNGLDVSLISTGGDDKTWSAVISGNASFGVSDPTFVAVSDAKGVKGRVIASIVNGVPFWGITFKNSINKFNLPKDIQAYSVGTFPSPSTAYTLQKKMFMDAGIKPNIHEGAFGTILAMLHSNQVDIGLELEPNVSQAVSEGGKILYSLANIYGNFAITGLTSTPELLTKHPDMAKKVVCSIQQALQLIHDDPDLALSILIKRFPEIRPEIAKQAFTRVIAEGIIPSDAVITKDAWDKAISLRKEVGDIKSPKTIENYVDNSYAEWAKKNCKINNVK